MPKSLKDISKIPSATLFPVVGVGASAGGLEAFKKFIKSIPEHSGMAYVLVQHLHPDHDSLLPEILQRETRIPVYEIKNNVEVKPDTIYIIPANKILIATDGVLQLKQRPATTERNLPIDIFFTSLAEIHQSDSIGIVLSGTGTDGTEGLKKIKDNGGITFAQLPESAMYNAMPRHAIDNEIVDFVMEPEKMALQLLRLGKTFNILKEVANPEGSEEENFKSIITLLRLHQKIDFTYYKQTTVRRRILRRLGILKMEKLTEYIGYLKSNRIELDLLLQDLLIPVTNFFRDTKTFDNLCQQVCPELVKSKGSGKGLRIWVAGCSTGEEAYSIGICLQEYLALSGSSVKVEIFATDVSEKSIAIARLGQYVKAQMDGVSEERREQFFIKSAGTYQVKKNIRDMCVFAVHNFLKDPPFARIDLLSCRNVLIYMEPFIQKRALDNFHYALGEKGLLLLGKSETTGVAEDLYFAYGKSERLFKKKVVPGRYMHVTSDRSEEDIRSNSDVPGTKERVKEDFQKSADTILLSKYTPPGVIVNERFEIVQFRGQTGKYLEHSPGSPSLNILKMVKEGLAFEVRNALHKAKSSNEIFIKPGIALSNENNLVTIEVMPLAGTVEPYFLILFRDTKAPYKGSEDTNEQARTPESSGENVYTKKIQEELVLAREDMRNITQDQEAANEELQSANEELLSSSEELQSLNEELETSKEELQSTNEELVTVNQELIDRNTLLDVSRIYSETIVNIMHEPLLVLDRNFKIKNANRSFFETFKITDTETIGKILFNLQDEGWNIPGLKSHLLNMHIEGEKMIDWEMSYHFPSAGNRTIHFNAQPMQQENGENWILLALHDITVRRELESINKKYAENLKKILENIPQITFIAAPNGRFTYFNRNFLEYSGMSFEEVITNGWEPVVKTEMLEVVKQQWTHSLQMGQDFRMEISFKRSRDQTYRWHLTKATAIRNEAGDITSWIGAAIDINDEKVKADVKSEFIGIASHELKTPLTTAKAYIQLLEQKFADENDESNLFIKKAAGAIERLNSLVAELLDVSKIQNGRLELTVAPFDINEMLGAAVESVQFTSDHHKLLLTGKIDHAVTGDQERLKQVVVNLLTNAVKFSPGKDTVQVHVAERDNEIIVSVIDRGIGINKENINKIFEMYYRAEDKNFHVPGLGIGLSISAEIIARHNGRMWAESQPGKGSTFYFTLPQ